MINRGHSNLAKFDAFKMYILSCRYLCIQIRCLEKKTRLVMDSNVEKFSKHKLDSDLA